MASWLATPGGTREVRIMAELYGEGQEVLNPHAINVGALGHGHFPGLEYLQIFFKQMLVEMVTFFFLVAISRRQSMVAILHGER